MNIIHNSWLEEYRQPFGAASVSSVCSISIDIIGSDNADVVLRLWKDDIGESLVEMKKDSTYVGDADRYSVSMQLPADPCLVWYYFIIKNNDEILYYGNNEAHTGGVGKVYEQEPPAFQITVYKPSVTPSWFKDGICYQIFPDRFNRDHEWNLRTIKSIMARENRILANNNNSEYQRQFIEEDWSKPAYYIKDEEGNVTEWPIYGGSLKGIEEKLDYLKSYGVTSIYLNPIFEAVSNHRYDTADYFKIDAALGTEEDFKDLCKAAEERGISIILDGVFSHTGADSIYFDKYGNYGGEGAYSKTDSKYRYWYTFDENEECGYKAWWGVKDLPEVKEDNLLYRHMITGDDGVIKKWIQAGAKGWRLDVADELPDKFIKLIRSSLKELGDDKLLLGEVWEDASNKISYDQKREFLFGDELDSTMNYPLRTILLDYINYTISSATAADRLMSLKENYPRENYYGALNVIGTHDRRRILNEMAASEVYDSAYRKSKIMSVLQYALPGVPCIYYGDEIAMMGETDPENRNPMDWVNKNLDMSYHYRMLGLIYDEHPVLKNGEMDMLSNKYDCIPDDVLAFIRYDEREQILVLINRSYGATNVDLSSFAIPERSYALELLTSTEMNLSGNLELEALSAKIILIKRDRPHIAEKPRKSGVICHISSLPGGTLGKPARDFVDWLAEAGFKVWQVLPLNPKGIGDCPYNSVAAFAGEPSFVNLDEIPEDYDGFIEFYDNNKFWLENYIHYSLPKRQVKLANGTDAGLGTVRNILINEQYYFYRQWKELKEYANRKGIEIMGDLPIYVAADSADVMGNRKYFLTDRNGKLKMHAGVPADDFSDNGQDWGHALYDWKKLKDNNYDWWVKRIKQCAERYDILRLDHFRGFSEYFAIPSDGTPSDGNWQHGPGLDFFEKIRSALAESGLKLDILAEDLGLLDAGVLNLIKLTGYPGMNIWEFSADEMLAMPDDVAKNRAFYTGTHDNQTLVGWLKSNNPDKSYKEIQVMALDVIKSLYKSKAGLVMLQLQDVFLLGDEARMNVPGVAEGNWTWQIPGPSLSEAFPNAYNGMTTWFKKLNEHL